MCAARRPACLAGNRSLAGWSPTYRVFRGGLCDFQYPLEELGLRLGNSPLAGRDDQVHGKVEVAQEVADTGSLVPGDDDADAQLAEPCQSGANVVIEVGLVESLSAASGFAGVVLGTDIDARTG